MRALFLTCMMLIFMAGIGCLSAQALNDLPAPPPSGLSDEGHVLGNNSDLQREIIGKLKQLETEHGYRLYVILERSLIATTPTGLAADLQQKWMPNGEGLVVVFESDTGKMGFGRGLDSSEAIMEGEQSVPAYSLVEIIADALHACAGIDVPDLFVQKLVSEMCKNLDAYLDRRNAPEEGGRSLRLALATIGALSLLALGGMVIGWMMGKADKKQSRIMKFPEIHVPERLGAPYGGGGGGSSYFGR
ncbi:MAG: TPM domain-containing protein [Luteolibacter sp.]